MAPYPTPYAPESVCRSVCMGVCTAGVEGVEEVPG